MAVILVTGSNGHLMRNVIPKLIDHGHDVLGVDNFSRHTYYSHPKSEYFREYKGDATDLDSMLDIIKSYRHYEKKSIDYIINGAATIFGVGGFNNYCSTVLNTDLKIQSTMLTLAKELNVKKFVYISSSMVYEKCRKKYEGNSEQEPFEEIPPPATEYGLSKYVGEKMVFAANKQYGLDYVIWRPFNILNPTEIAESVQGNSHVFADFIEQIVGQQKLEIPLIGDGQQIRCFTWIDDVARAIADYSFMEDNDPFKVYNIGVVDPIAMKYLAWLISSIANKMGLYPSGTLTFKTVKEYPNDVKYRVPNVDKITEKFGFKTTKTLEEGIEACILEYVKRNKNDS
jgi:nucleoside-diphosphate-sugar epimerase